MHGWRPLNFALMDTITWPSDSLWPSATPEGQSLKPELPHGQHQKYSLSLNQRPAQQVFGDSQGAKAMPTQAPALPYLGQQRISAKGQRLNIEGSADHMVTGTTIQLSTDGAAGHRENKWT